MRTLTISECDLVSGGYIYGSLYNCVMDMCGGCAGLDGLDLSTLTNLIFQALNANFNEDIALLQGLMAAQAGGGGGGGGGATATTDAETADSDGEPLPNFTIDPDYGDTGVFEPAQSFGGISIDAIAADSQGMMAAAKSLLGAFSETDLGKEVAASQASGEGNSPNILINSGAISYDTVSDNFTLYNKNIFINSTKPVPIASTTGDQFETSWQRILIHEFLHVAFPDMEHPELIAKTNSVKHLWNGVLDRDPNSHAEE